MKNNTYFEELRAIAAAFEEKRAAHESRKQHLIDTYGWDSEEVKAWYREKEEMTYPISEGACKAYRAFRMTEQQRVRDGGFPLGARGFGFHRRLKESRDHDLCLHQPEHGSDGEPSRLR